MKRIKVLHLIGTMDLGGAEKLTRLIIEGLPSDRFEANVCCIKRGGLYAEQLREKGFNAKILINLEKHKHVTTFGLAKSAFKLFLLLRREKPDILHTHLFLTSCLGRLVGRVAGVKKIVVTLHRIEYPRLEKWTEHFFTFLTNLYITDSYAAAARIISVLKIPESKIKVIHNGIDLVEFASPPSAKLAREALGLPEDEIVIGVIAHLYREKGHLFLLKSLCEIKDQLGKFKLIIVGDGYLRQELESEALRLLPAKSVVFLGQRGDLATMLAAMDVFVLPSSWEGFGIILAEAMYMGVPVVTTCDGGGTAEVVQEGEGGLLVPYGDMSALGNAILQLLLDRDYHRAQSNRGRARVERMFTADIMCKNYSAAYNKLFIDFEMNVT